MRRSIVRNFFNIIFGPIDTEGRKVDQTQKWHKRTFALVTEVEQKIIDNNDEDDVKLT